MKRSHKRVRAWRMARRLLRLNRVERIAGGTALAAGLLVVGGLNPPGWVGLPVGVICVLAVFGLIVFRDVVGAPVTFGDLGRLPWDDQMAALVKMTAIAARSERAQIRERASKALQRWAASQQPGEETRWIVARALRRNGGLRPERGELEAALGALGRDELVAASLRGDESSRALISAHRAVAEVTAAGARDVYAVLIGENDAVAVGELAEMAVLLQQR